MMTALLLALVSASAGAGTRTFEITASRFKFEPARVEVNVGDRVRLLVHSADGTHGIALKAFGVAARIPKGGETVSVEFVADRPGTFDFACSEYCGVGHKKMQGTLVVSPRQ